VSGDQRMHDMAAIVIEILRGYALPERCPHGVVHWARVLENGLRIANSMKQPASSRRWTVRRRIESAQAT
jgi:hypothetical protein